MPKKKAPKKPGSTALNILKALENSPEGLDIVQLRNLVLRPGEPQQQFDRRLRELDPFYIIERSRKGQLTNYQLVGPRPEGNWEYNTIPKQMRAQALNQAGGRCRMCGSSIEKDNIRLHVDHKIPQSWGGKTEPENLWAIYSACNEGKKDYFATFDTEMMTAIMQHNSVHMRIAELLHLNQGQWVDCDLIEFVAGSMGQQTDWRKRLRELRYLGLDIESRRQKRGPRILSQYLLSNWVDLPGDPTRAAREYEKMRANLNREFPEKEKP